MIIDFKVKQAVFRIWSMFNSLHLSVSISQVLKCIAARGQRLASSLQVIKTHSRMLQHPPPHPHTPTCQTFTIAHREVNTGRRENHQILQVLLLCLSKHHDRSTIKNFAVCEITTYWGWSYSLAKQRSFPFRVLISNSECVAETDKCYYLACDRLQHRKDSG